MENVKRIIGNFALWLLKLVGRPNESVFESDVVNVITHGENIWVATKNGCFYKGNPELNEWTKYM